MDKQSKIFVAGHNGLVGSALVKNLKEKGYSNIITKTRQELDLLDQNAVKEFFEVEKPVYVFVAAAKVGGILANNVYRADFIYENLQVQNNVIHFSYLNNVKKLLFLGSTCIYPKNAQQPMSEDCLLTGELEYTNEPYAIAKIAGIKMCESYNLQYGTNFISVMPTNLYGPNDNFNLETSHVLPALMMKMHLARLLSEKKINEILLILKKDKLEDVLSYLNKYGISEDRVEIWGTGSPMREFLWSEDMADACVYIMENVNFSDLVNMASLSNPTLATASKEVRNTHINIGSGSDISIKDLAYLIKNIVQFDGEIYFDSTKPDGTMKKLTNVTKLHKLGWQHSVELKDGITKLYEEFTRSLI